MPDRVEVQDIACPAGTTEAAPLETVLDGVVNCQVVRVTIRIPAGHSGLTGIALGYAHNPVLPRTAGRFISGDDEVIEYDLRDYIEGPQWQAFTVNHDTISHAWQIRFEVDELTDPAAGIPAEPVGASDIEQAAIAQVGIG